MFLQVQVKNSADVQLFLLPDLNLKASVCTGSFVSTETCRNPQSRYVSVRPGLVWLSHL